jgi:NAD(P) transhydrogenase subunit alpha
VLDADYEAAGRQRQPRCGVKDADIVIKVKRPEASEARQIQARRAGGRDHGSLWQRGRARGAGHAGVSAFAMEFMPRITRAQVMDVLSSQANLAGYRR